MKSGPTRAEIDETNNDYKADGPASVRHPPVLQDVGEGRN